MSNMYIDVCVFKYVMMYICICFDGIKQSNIEPQWDT
jgi:hypothetical protein